MPCGDIEEIPEGVSRCIYPFSSLLEGPAKHAVKSSDIISDDPSSPLSEPFERLGATKIGRNCRIACNVASSSAVFQQHFQSILELKRVEIWSGRYFTVKAR